MTALSWDIAIGVAFVVGVLLLGISSAMLRSARAKPPVPESSPEPLAPPLAREPQQQTPPAEPLAPPPLWPRLIDGELREASAAMRAEIVERLAIVDNAWSRDLLERARQEEREPSVLAAIDRALARTQ